MNKWKDKLIRFMYGRYGGNDALNKTLLWGYLIILLVGAITNLTVLWYVGMVALVFCMYRIFSKNIGKRQAENAAFLKFRGKLKIWFAPITDRKHVYRTCPNCGAKLRLPRKKGKHTVGCPKCGTDFVVKI